MAARALALMLALAAPAAAAPARVVSINLCTDQLAMLLAAPGQLVAVTHLAADPRASAMAAEAAGLPTTRGQAEEVFALAPDLVLAGTFTARPTVALLRRLGVPVLELPPASRLADVPDHLMRIGAALGREAEAAARAADFRRDLAALRRSGALRDAVLYYPNGYTTGAGTMADDILAHTAFRNAGAAAGVTGGGVLPLERLVLAAPDLIVTSAPYPGASRSEEILRHPAVAAVQARAAGRQVSDADWICGTPAILRAVAGMAAARAAIGP
ncbi:MAG: ABC transporter substrate-binding protein [Gemmobacter sp.]